MYPTPDAMKLADELELDLVEISPKADPPVCRIIDYQKFLYQQRKKQKEQKQNAVQVSVKEVRFGPNTDEHDYNFKLKHAEKFLNDGDKTKITVRYRGREMAHRELGMDQLKRIEKDLEEIAVVEQFPKLEGRQMVMVMAPKKKK